jgi:hypothetical protein
MSGNKTSFVEQLKQNPLFLTMSGVLIGSVTEQIEGFTGIPSLVVSIFAVLLTLIPLVWALSVWLKKRNNYPPTNHTKVLTLYFYCL